MKTSFKLDQVESDLREYFASKGIAIPANFPCPIKQRITGEQALNRYIDHTLLKQSAKTMDYHRLFAEAREWKPFSVCVPPVQIPEAVRFLKGTEVQTCTVVGFPWGYESSKGKVSDTVWSLSKGCDEIDMVMSVGKFLDGKYLDVYDDIRAVADAAKGHLLKVIIESAELTSEEIAQASFISAWAGAWFVKTSTGFASGGASVEAVRIMRSVAGDLLGVKASGGIRDRAFTQSLIEAGADRIGASATGVILGLSP